MQKTVLIALAVVGTLTAGYFLFRNQPVKPDPALKGIYNQWKVDQKINVGAAEDEYRFGVFAQTYNKVQQHNSIASRTYDMGLNAFSHLTKEEFAATHLGLNYQPKSLTSATTFFSGSTLQKTADWTGKLNAAKNQGSCGGCWAFGTIGSIEGLYSIQKNTLLDLAEQEVIDCSSSKYGTFGCGGSQDLAGPMQFMVDNKGVSLTKEYPYKAADGTCAPKSKTAPITGFTNVQRNSPDALKAAIAQQPVTIAIDATPFQSYKSGIITSKSCSTRLNHAIVAVGFDDAASTPYYTVRNSWGTGWGDKGHAKMSIEAGAGTCGIHMLPVFPTL